MKLSNEFLEKQKKALLEEKERIETKATKLKKYPKYGDDEEDNLQEMADYESNLSLDDQLEYLLGKINKALKAIEEGTYGQCSLCKKNIENGRLEIMPYADVCVTCKSKKSK